MSTTAHNHLPAIRLERPVDGGIKTMSSTDIAELTGKRHDNVVRDIRAMCTGLKIEASVFEDSYKDDTGRSLVCFQLPRRECLILVSGYNIELRARIIDRWEELEQRTDAFAALNDPAAMRGMLLSYTERVLELEAKVAEGAETAQAFDRIAGADGSTCITDAAKTLQMRPKDLFSYMRQHHWIYRRAGTSTDLGYQSKVNSGLLEHKITVVTRADGSEKETVQVRVTAKGLTVLAKLLPPVAAAA